MGFDYQPDFIVKRKGVWFRLEVEKLSSNYHHPPNHSDIVLCYHNDSKRRDVEVISLEDLGELDAIDEYQRIEDMITKQREAANQKFAEETRSL